MMTIEYQHTRKKAVLHLRKDRHAVMKEYYPTDTLVLLSNAHGSLVPDMKNLGAWRIESDVQFVLLIEVP